MTHWITKYALSSGIQTLEGATEANGYLSKRGSFAGRSWEDQSHFYGREDWHLTKEAAIERAEEMRLAKIKSLKKSLAKLEALSFESVRQTEAR